MYSERGLHSPPRILSVRRALGAQVGAGLPRRHLDSSKSASRFITASPTPLNFSLRRWVLDSDAGTPEMHVVSDAIKDGAQVRAIPARP